MVDHVADGAEVVLIGSLYVLPSDLLVNGQAGEHIIDERGLTLRGFMGAIISPKLWPLLMAPLKKTRKFSGFS